MNKWLANTLVTVVAALVLTGCHATLPETGSNEVVKPTPLFGRTEKAERQPNRVAGNGGDEGFGLFGSSRSLPALLTYQRRLMEYSDSDLEREIDSLARQVNGACDVDRLKLGIAVLQRGGPKAEKQWSTCDDTAWESEEMRDFGLMIKTRIRAQTALARENASLRKQLQTQKEQSEKLQQQVEGLKAIERSLRARHRTVPALEE